MNLLSKTMFRRDVDSATGDHVLRYRGPGKWIGRLYGYGHDAFFTVTPRELPLPTELWPVADKAGLPLDRHPLVETFRKSVIDALMAEALVEAPVLLEEYVAAPLAWSEAVGIALEREHVSALNRVRGLVEEMKRDLERRIRIKERSIGLEPNRVPDKDIEISIPVPESVEDTKSSVQPPSPVPDKVHAAIKAAREAQLPQRIPSGIRRRLGKMSPGIYLVDVEEKNFVQDKLGDLTAGFDVARASKRVVIVIDWDGEWPVVVRKFGIDGVAVYKVEQAASRAGVETHDEAAQ